VSWVGTHLHSPAATERWSWSVGTIDDYRSKPPPKIETLYSELLRSGAGIGGKTPGSIADLRRGLDAGWVVTQNEDGKIFVHQGQIGRKLVGLRYVIEQGLGGQWMCTSPSPTASEARSSVDSWARLRDRDRSR